MGANKGYIGTERFTMCGQVKPILARLKTTLTGSGLALLVSAVLLVGLIRNGADSDGQYGALLMPIHTRPSFSDYGSA